MFVFAVVLFLFLLLSVIVLVLTGESFSVTVVPFTLLVFFTLYLMGIGS